MTQINILYEGIQYEDEGLTEIPGYNKNWLYESYQSIYKFIYSSKNKIVLQKKKLQQFMLIQAKTLLQNSHFGSDYEFFLLNNYWSLNRNFCMPYVKKLNQIINEISKTLTCKQYPLKYIISGYTLIQLLNNVPLNEVTIILYFVGQKNLILKVENQYKFGTDNYFYLQCNKFKKIMIYRNYFKTYLQAITYMNLQIFYYDQCTYCRPQYLQSKRLFQLQNKLEIPIEKQNRLKGEIKLFSKNIAHIELFYRKHSLINFTMTELKCIWQRCYICKNYASKIKFYNGIQIDFRQHSQICDFHKLQQHEYLKLTTNLTGKYALVTGGRVKIGYSLVLRLLRNGARVFALTRYPHLALLNYQKQIDYQNFKDRLIIIQCDLANIPYLTNLIKKIKQQIVQIRGQSEPIFDILINNACHTVAPPQKFYELAYQAEKQIKLSIKDSKINMEQNKLIKKQKDTETQIQIINCQTIKIQNFSSDIKLNKFNDIDIEFEKKNSWNKSLSQLSVQEILMANLINQIAPTMIIRELVQSHNPNLQGKYIIVINVTSSEGYFRAKNDLHIHTNMAKASLDMLSFSLNESSKIEKNRKYFYSVDPGFVSSVVVSNSPLSAQEGASRIFYPIYRVNQHIPLNEYRYKDYKFKHN